MQDFTSKAWSFIEGLQSKDERTMTVTDPVCGMQIDIQEAAAQEDHGGWAYFFCSAQCHRLFRGNPERYVAGAQSVAVSSTAKVERDDNGQG
jgi:Cu+-exporting ATPase